MTRMIIGVQQNFGAIGCGFGTRTAVVAGINTSVVIPQGWWLVETDAHTTVRFTYNSGSNFVTLVAASGAAVIWSDGFSVEFRGDGTGGTGQQSAINGAN
jgi:hypothetical protein